jgi:Uma2 family endonuclease
MTAQTAEAAPSAAPALRMTYDEFLDWLDEDKHAEWVDGEVIMHSPVSARHQSVGRLLLSTVGFFVEDRQLGVVLYDPFQMRTGPGLPSRAPNLLFVANENRPRLRPTYLDGPADLVVEIVSPESRGRDRGEKHFEYERGGVREYWLIDPERTLAEFHQLGEDRRYHLAPLDADGCFHSEALPGLWLRVAWLWQEPLPSVRDVLQEWGLV